MALPALLCFYLNDFNPSLSNFKFKSCKDTKKEKEREKQNLHMFINSHFIALHLYENK